MPPLPKAYPTKLADDLERLAHSGLDEGERACISHIASQKRLLYDNLELAKALRA